MKSTTQDSMRFLREFKPFPKEKKHIGISQTEQGIKTMCCPQRGLVDLNIRARAALSWPCKPTDSSVV
jgi:hypothetical protein